MEHCQWDKSNKNYDGGNKVIYNTEVLKSNLCDCNDAYILVILTSLQYIKFQLQ